MIIKKILKSIIVGFTLVGITCFFDLKSIDQYEKDISSMVSKYDDIFFTEKYDRKYNRLCSNNIYTDFYYENRKLRSSICVSDNKMDLKTYHNFSRNGLNIYSDLELLFKYDHNNDFFAVENFVYRLVETCLIEEDFCEQTFNIGTNTMKIRVSDVSTNKEKQMITIDYYYKKAF